MVEKKYKLFSEIQSDLHTGRISCVELVGYYLSVIGDKNNILNAFVEVYADEARLRAIEIDQKIKANTAGKLAGMVIGLKDVLCYENHGLQAGSKILNNFKSKFTATAVQRLIDEDVIIIGRQNCDEFAMGSSNENSAFGVVANAADTNRVPGGSSGGSAVAVQSGMCFASIGSDTGGSVRQPAAFCGLVGLKPTYGRISRWGLIAYGSSFDCIGPITNSVEDAALLLEVMAGSDGYDSTVSSKPVEKYSQLLGNSRLQIGGSAVGIANSDQLKNRLQIGGSEVGITDSDQLITNSNQLINQKLKIGYLRESIESEGVQEEIKVETKNLLTQLKSLGHEVKPFEFELLDAFLPTYYILTTAEASSNLSRFDGVRYGHRSSESTNLESLYKKSRTEGFGKEVKKRILLGSFVLSANYYDAYYTKAQKVRRLIQERTKALFTEFDFLVMPTTPTTAFKIGDKTSDSLQMYLADIFTVQANVTGYPAISIPRGLDKNNMPIGLQIMGKPFQEAQLLNFAYSL